MFVSLEVFFVFSVVFSHNGTTDGGTTSLAYLAVVTIADVLLDMVALASWHVRKSFLPFAWLWVTTSFHEN